MSSYNCGNVCCVDKVFQDIMIELRDNHAKPLTKGDLLRVLRVLRQEGRIRQHSNHNVPIHKGN